MSQVGARVCHIRECGTHSRELPCKAAATTESAGGAGPMDVADAGKPSEPSHGMERGNGLDGEEKSFERLEVLPFPAARSAQEGFLVMMLPWRNLFALGKMVVLNIAFPRAFEVHDFRTGVTEAFKFVHAALSEGDHGPLRDLLSEELIEKLAKEQPQDKHTAKPRYELHETRLLGLLRAWPVQLPEGDGVLKVQALFYAEEDAIVETCADAARAEEDGAAQSQSIRYRQKCLHAWTFERPLFDDGEQPPGDWYIADMDRLSWPPVHFPPPREV